MDNVPITALENVATELFSPLQPWHPQYSPEIVKYGYSTEYLEEAKVRVNQIYQESVFLGETTKISKELLLSQKDALEAFIDSHLPELYIGQVVEAENKVQSLFEQLLLLREGNAASKKEEERAKLYFDCEKLLNSSSRFFNQKFDLKNLEKSIGLQGSLQNIYFEMNHLEALIDAEKRIKALFEQLLLLKESGITSESTKRILDSYVFCGKALNRASRFFNQNFDLVNLGKSIELKKSLNEIYFTIKFLIDADPLDSCQANAPFISVSAPPIKVDEAKPDDFSLLSKIKFLAVSIGIVGLSVALFNQKDFFNLDFNSV